MGLNIFKVIKKKQKFLKKKELKYISFKVIQTNNKIPFSTKKYNAFLAKNWVQKLDVNRCFLSGRAAGIYKPWNLSRFFIRNLSTQKYIFGLKKSSW